MGRLHTSFLAAGSAGRVAALACALLGSCRPALELCNRGACDLVADSNTDEDVGGASGFGGQSQALAGTLGNLNSGGEGPISGAGGAADARGCRADADCGDRRACNGTETCESGACRAGKPIDCQPGTRCQEAAGRASCLYSSVSDWVVLLSPSQVWGLRSSQWDGGALTLLGERPSDYPYVGFDSASWSPDGQRLWIGYGNPDGDSELYELFMGDMPSALRKPGDLPNRGQFHWAFDDDGRSAAVSDGYTGDYLLRFVSGGTDSWLVHPAPEEGSTSTSPSFCRNANTWLFENGGFRLVSATETSFSVRALEGDGVSISPDRAQLLVSTTVGVGLMPCDIHAESTPLLEGSPQTLYWSPASRHFAVEVADVLHLFALGGSGAVSEIWSGAASIAAWSKDGSQLLLLSDDVTTPNLWLELGPSSVVSQQPFPLDPDDQIEGFSGDELLLWRAGGTGARQLIAFPREPARSRVLSTDAGDAELVWYSLQGGRALLRRNSSQRWQLSLLLFDELPPREEILLSVDPQSSISVSETGAAALVENGSESLWVRFPVDGLETQIRPLPSHTFLVSPQPQ